MRKVSCLEYCLDYILILYVIELFYTEITSLLLFRWPFAYCINPRNVNDIFKIKDNCMVHKIFPKTFPKSVSYILLKCLYASHSPGGVPKTAIKFHILHSFLLLLTYSCFFRKRKIQFE